MLRSATPRSARSTKRRRRPEEPGARRQRRRSAASSCDATSSHARVVDRHVRTWRRRPSSSATMVERAVQLVHAELVHEVAERIEVRVVLRRRGLDAAPPSRRPAATRWGVARGTPRCIRRSSARRSGRSCGARPGSGALAPRDHRRPRTSVGRITTVETGDENQRSITRIAGLVDHGPRRRQQLRAAAATTPPAPAWRGRRPTGHSPSTAWRSSRSIADDERPRVGVVVDQQRDRGVELDVAAVPAAVRDEALVGGEQHLDRPRPRRRRSTPVGASAVDRRLDEIEHDERPLEPATGVADPPRRAAHDALVPQPGERREVGEHGVEIVDAGLIGAERGPQLGEVRQHAPGRHRQVLAHGRGLGQQASDLVAPRRRSATGARSSQVVAGRSVAAIHGATGTQHAAHPRRSHPPPSSAHEAGILLDPRGDHARSCAPSPPPVRQSGSSSTGRRRHASAPIARSRPAGAAVRRTASACGRAPTRPWPRTPSDDVDRPRARARGPCRPAAPTTIGPSSTANIRSTTAASPARPARRRAAVGTVASGVDPAASRGSDCDAAGRSRSIAARRGARARGASTTPAPWALASVTPPDRTACSRPGTPERTVGGDLERIDGRVLEPAVQHVDRFEPVERAQPHAPLPHDEVGALDEVHAELHGEVRVVDVRRMVEAAGEQDDARARRRRRGGQRPPHRARVAGDRGDLVAAPSRSGTTRDITDRSSSAYPMPGGASVRSWTTYHDAVGAERDVDGVRGQPAPRRGTDGVDPVAIGRRQHLGRHDAVRHQRARRRTGRR